MRIGLETMHFLTIVCRDDDDAERFGNLKPEARAPNMLLWHACVPADVSGAVSWLHAVRLAAKITLDILLDGFPVAAPPTGGSMSSGIALYASPLSALNGIFEKKEKKGLVAWLLLCQVATEGSFLQPDATQQGDAGRTDIE